MKTILPAATPYRAGDPITVLFDDRDIATLTVERCIALAVPGRWQVTARRPDKRLFDVAVDADGFDRAGNVSRPTTPKPASTTRQSGARRP